MTGVKFKMSHSLYWREQQTWSFFSKIYQVYTDQPMGKVIQKISFFGITKMRLFAITIIPHHRCAILSLLILFKTTRPQAYLLSHWKIAPRTGCIIMTVVRQDRSIIRKIITYIIARTGVISCRTGKFSISLVRRDRWPWKLRSSPGGYDIPGNISENWLRQTGYVTIFEILLIHVGISVVIIFHIY